MLKLLSPILLFITLFLLINNLALLPKTEYLKKEFIQEKKKEAQFNIKASEYGQQFGNWFLYVNEEKDNIYKDIVLFKQEGDKDTIIISKNATIENNTATLSLNLNTGRLIEIKDNLSQIDFNKMVINNELKQSRNINSITDLIQYWSEIHTNKTRMYWFTFGILISFFPLISILFIIALGYYNPRYDKNHSTSLSLLLATVFLISAQKLADNFGLIILYTAPIVWILLSYITYKIKITKYY